MQKAEWILELRKEGLMPSLLILETDISDGQILDKEREWILHHIASGAPLTNKLKILPKPEPKQKYIPSAITTMPVKKVEYIDANEAASILSRNSGHKVSSDYVRLLSNQKKLTSRPKDGRTKEYLRSDVEAYRVVGKGKNRKP